MTARGGHRAGSSRQNHADTEAAAERAQAKRFAKMLRRELFNEINEKLVAVDVEWHLRCESEGDVEPPQRLVIAPRACEGNRKNAQGTDRTIPPHLNAMSRGVSKRCGHPDSPWLRRRRCHIGCKRNSTSARFGNKTP